MANAMTLGEEPRNQIDGLFLPLKVFLLLHNRTTVILSIAILAGSQPEAFKDLLMIRRNHFSNLIYDHILPIILVSIYK